MTKKKSATRRDLPKAYTQVHSLWLSVRAIAQHEDRLCTLMHAIRQQGVVDADLRVELRTLLDELPAEEYLRDVADLGVALAVPGAVKSARGKTAEATARKRIKGRAKVGKPKVGKATAGKTTVGKVAARGAKTAKQKAGSGAGASRAG